MGNDCDGVSPLVDNIAAADPFWGTPFGYDAAAANSGVATVNQSGFIGGGEVGYNDQCGKKLEKLS